MKEIGGYIELDSYTGTEYHPPEFGLNCGRNALAFLFESRHIKKLYIPYYLCDSISNVCKKHNIPYEYYHIDGSLLPIFDKKLEKGEYLYIVNYYGQIHNYQFIEWHSRHNQVIVDNSHAFFQQPCSGIDTIYTCRKYFGVPDGAYLITDSKLERELEIDVSFERMRFLLGRYEKGASDFYSEYIKNNRSFKHEPLKKMSKLTHNLLRAIDYESIKKRRTDNYSQLHETFYQQNQLTISTPTGAYMYPLLIENGLEIRKRLVEQRIYIPVLWPSVLETEGVNNTEKYMVENILPLPCDQRYSGKDLFEMGEVIKKCIS